MLGLDPRHWFAGAVALAIAVIGCGGQDFDALFAGTPEGGSEAGAQGGACGDAGLVCSITCLGGSCDCGNSSSNSCSPICNVGSALCVANCGLQGGAGCSMNCPAGATCILRCTALQEGQVTPTNCGLTCPNGAVPTHCGDKGLLCGNPTQSMCG